MTTIQKTKSKALRFSEQPVQGPLAIFACLVSVSLSGMLAVQLTNPDQGKLVTAAEMNIRMQQEAVRIQNDTHMPRQAKAIALSMLNQSRTMGAYLRQVRPR